MHACVIVLITHGTDGSRVWLHVVHGDVRAAALSSIPEAARDLVDVIARRRVAGMLHTLDRFEAPQRLLEQLGARPWTVPLPKAVHPLLYHDADTLYAGFVFGLVGTPCKIARRTWGLPRECPSCGLRDPWGVSATPPFFRKRRRRRILDTPAAFCWNCLFTRPARHEPLRD